MMKKRLRGILCGLCIGSLLLSIPAFALNVDILSPTASAGQNSISVSGEADCAKVNVEIWNSDKILITTREFSVSSGSFSGTIDTGSLPDGTYTVKYADLEGGPYTVRTVQVSSSSTNPDTPVTEPKTEEINPSATVDKETGIANAAVSEKDITNAVAAAMKNGSKTIIIAPKVPDGTGGVSVSIPGVSASLIGKEHKTITVKTPVAQIIIGSEGLSGLAKDTKEISVSAEMDGSGVIAIAIKADNKSVKQVNGGIAAIVPIVKRNDTTVIALVNKDGTEIVLPKSLMIEAGILVQIDGTATIKVLDNKKFFDDVTDNSWVAGPVAFVSSRELFNGTGNKTFSPEMGMTRGMLATVLHRLELNPASDGMEVFGDVAPNSWYADSVGWAASVGIVQGIGSGRFDGDREISRAELVTILYRYAKYAGLDTNGSADLNGFSDSESIPSWATEAFAWAVSAEVISGTDNGALLPTTDATRGQVAKVIMEMVKVLVQ